MPERICPVCHTSFFDAEAQCPEHRVKLVTVIADDTGRVGERIDEKYEIELLIGRGGMGEVYRAHQVSMDRQVALKVLGARFSREAPLVRRFLREAKASSRLNHPNVITVFDFGQTEAGELYLVMELLRGRPLTDLIGSDGPLDPVRAVGIAAQICDALTEAHSQGVVHRDLKPDNIFVRETSGHLGDFVKVLDFGIAKIKTVDGTEQLTKTGAVCGTPMYMSPEQASGMEVAPTSDIYSLGVVLYEMLSARQPFGGATPMELLLAHVRTPPPPLSGLVAVPAELASLCMRMLAKEPSERPGDAATLGKALKVAVGAPAPVTRGSTDPEPDPLAATLASEPGLGTEPAVQPAPARSGASALLAVGAVLVLATVVGLAIFFGRKTTEYQPVEPDIAGLPVVGPASADPPPAAPTSGPEPTATPASAPTPLFDAGRLPAFPGRDRLLDDLRAIDGIVPAEIWGRSRSQVEARGGWEAAEITDTRPFLSELTRTYRPAPGKRLVVRLGFLDDRLFRVYVRLFQLAPELRPDLEAAFGRPADSKGTDPDGVGFVAWTVDDVGIRARRWGKLQALEIAEPDSYADYQARYAQVGPAEVLTARSARLFWAKKAENDEVIEVSEKALELVPGYGDALANLCHAFYDLGRLKKAVGACRKAEAVTGEASVKAEAAYYLGLVAASRGQRARAVRRLKAAKEGLPSGYVIGRRLARRLRGLQGSRDAAVVRSALEEVVCFEQRGVSERAKRVPAEFGFDSPEDLAAQAAELGIEATAPRRCHR